MSLARLLARSEGTWIRLDLQVDTVVVVQAHSEDFVGGCGGLVRHLVEAGASVSLLTLFQSGRDAPERRLREAEIRSTGAFLGIHTSEPLGEPDDGDGLLRRLWDHLLARDPEMILLPFDRPEVERHPQHVLAAQLVTTSMAQGTRASLRWRYGNVTCLPDGLMAVANRALVLGAEDLGHRGALYRLHGSQAGRRPNPRWAALSGDEEAADYVELSDWRARYQLAALRGAAELERAAGVELFLSDRPLG